MPPLAPAAAVEPSKIRELAALAEHYPGTLRLFYGEDTEPTPDFLKAAAKQALDANHTYYAPNAGYPELRTVIADHVGRLHRLPIDPANVVVTASGMVAIQVACQATLGPGDSALVLSPLWPNLQAAIRVTGATAIEVPLRLTPSAYHLDLDRLESAVRPDTKLIALASPGNPTGWTATAADWAALVAFCERHDLWLLADGVYDRLVFGPDPVAPSPLAAPGAPERTIAINSFSKAYRMTGWRIGYAIAPPPVAARIPHLQEFGVSHAFGVTQRTAITALRDGEPFLAESLARYRRHRQITLDRLRQLPGVTVPEPTGAFYAFPRLDGLTDSIGFCNDLVREYRLGLAPGAAFGAGGEGHVRLCFAVDEPTLLEALDRFEAAWSRRREEPS